MVYVSGAGSAEQVSAIYVSPDGSARKVSMVYCGDAAGLSRLVCGGTFRVLIRNTLAVTVVIRLTSSAADSAISLAAGESVTVEPVRGDSGYELRLGKMSLPVAAAVVTSVRLKMKNGEEQTAAYTGTQGFSRNQFGIYPISTDVAEVTV